MNNNKIILGTAQLNNIYGYSNSKVKLNKLKFNKIIKIMRANQINFFDTAPSYNNDKILSSFLKKDDNLISKIDFNNNLSYTPKKIEKIVKNNFKNLNIKTLYGLLIHNIDSIYEKNFKKFYKQLRKQKKIKKFGFSCYKIEEVEYILDNFKFEILQFPFNVFDQRLVKKKNIITKLKQRGIEIHIRSIFLQGILLDNKIHLNSYFSYWKKLFNNYKRFRVLSKITNLESAIYFIKKYNFYDKIIIGVEKPEHLIKILYIFFSKNEKSYDFKKFNTSNKKLILPYLWKK